MTMNLLLFVRFCINQIDCISSGVSLDKKDASVTWDGKTEEFENASERLHIKQILLGHTAKDGEYNVVEVNSVRTIKQYSVQIIY